MQMTDSKARQQRTPLAEAYAHLADVSLAHELIEQACAAYRNAVALRPDRQEWHYLLGLLDIDQGQFAAGIESLDRAIDPNPRELAAEHFRRLADSVTSPSAASSTTPRTSTRRPCSRRSSVTAMPMHVPT